ncbi:putative powdery mildew resistance protein, RPW8 [Rosa chinensis]|uniref:Putative powdery mildew resistance protein, RPW8 n=1 Tax=Rosa chinensis TaxID=74649 RepID=A0A2P6RN80_ROSCH|nr:putative powdery mildew resistance protein, RPW8 [Rosa chinensis]
MAAVLAGGAVLGTVFSELYKGVQTLIRTSKHFKDLAKNIKLKLECLLPLIKQIEEQNMELGRSNQCTEKFKIEIVEGLELVQNCCKVGPLEISKQRNYIRELRELDGSLKNW